MKTCSNCGDEFRPNNMPAHYRACARDNVCSIDGCPASVRNRGWCAKHYVRWQKHGDPLKGGRQTETERFWAKVDQSDGCWLWIAGKSASGYGVFGQHLAHRWSYEYLVGPIPEGLDIDHLCRVRNCVNPEHLEPVTHRENLLRGDTVTAANAAKTHCPKGHPYSGENLNVRTRSDGRVTRECRSCQRDYYFRRGRELRRQSRG